MWYKIRRVLAGAVLAAALFLLFSCAGAPSVTERQPVPTDRGLVFHTGSRVDREGIPLLSLSGTHYEVGLQYGVLLGPEIRSVYGEFRGLLADLTGGGLRQYFLRLSLHGQIAAMRAALPPGFEEELQGIAQGAGIAYPDFLFFALTPELLFDTGCTSVVVRRGGEIVQGRNLDFFRPATLISRYPAIVRIAVEGKVPYVSVGFAGLPGVYTGFNMRGIAVSVNTAAFVKHSTKNAIPPGLLLKSILEECSTMSDVDALTACRTASHYLLTVSSRSERDAALYECLDDTVIKVPMTGDVLAVANAPLSAAHRKAAAAILSQAEYNVAREDTLRRLTSTVPAAPLTDYVLAILGNHDFYDYPGIPPHQTLRQDSGKTINGFGSIQSAVIDWSGNRVIVSYRSSYAGFGPFFSYDMATGELSRYRDADPFVATRTFTEGNDFLDKAFTLYRNRRMSLDREGWEQLGRLLDEYPGLDPFLGNDWRFEVALSLGHFDEAEQAARAIDAAYPDYYLGPLDRGLVAYDSKQWIEARRCFLDSLERPINSPATRFLALAYASLASEKAGDDGQGARLRGQARELLMPYWAPRDLAATVQRYYADAGLVSFISSLEAPAP